jgi:hypothetical protein
LTDFDNVQAPVLDRDPGTIRLAIQARTIPPA